MYQKTLYAGWGDMDYNGHMRNTAYLDKAGDVRMMFFAEHGLTMPDFYALRIGPVVMRDELDYRREVKLLDAITVSLALVGLAPDGSRAKVVQEFHIGTTLAARVTTIAGWLHLESRQLVVPPPALAAVLPLMQGPAPLESLPSSIRAGTP